MNLFWQQHKIIIGFFVLLTGLTAYSLVEVQPEEPTKTLSQLIDDPGPKNKSPSELFNERSPANIKLTSLDEKNDNKAVLKIFCHAENMKLKADTHLIMLDLVPCAELKDKYQLWVKNETNGFKAQIFKTNNGKFKTDFIQLNKGTNKILLEGILINGHKVAQTLEITSGS